MKKIFTFFVMLTVFFAFSSYAQNTVKINAASANVENVITMPDRATGWLTWCGELESLLGVGAAQVGIYQRLETTDLADHVGESITKIKFMPYNHSQAATVLNACTVRVYTGGSFNAADTTYNPGTLSVAQEVPIADVVFNNDNVITLTTPVAITGTEEIWFGVFYDVTSGYILTQDNGPAIEGKGNLMSYVYQGTEIWATSTTLFSTPYDKNYYLAAFALEEIIEIPTSDYGTAACHITIKMADEYGDGWNGGYIEIRDSEGALQAIVGDEVTDVAETTILLPHDNLSFIWNAGSYDNEVYFEIYDDNEALLFTCDSVGDGDTYYFNGEFYTFENDVCINGIDEYSTSFNVYNNGTEIVIDNPNNLMITNVELYNTEGKLMVQTADQRNISVSALSNGIYIVKINTDKATETYKVLIVKR